MGQRRWCMVATVLHWVLVCVCVRVGIDGMRRWFGLGRMGVVVVLLLLLVLVVVRTVFDCVGVERFGDDEGRHFGWGTRRCWPQGFAEGNHIAHNKRPHPTLTASYRAKV